MLDSDSRYGKNARIAGGIWCLLSGGPSSMGCARSWSASSAAVAIWTPRGVLETAAHMAVESPLSSSSECGAMVMPARSDDGILGLLRGQSTVGAVMSSWSGIFAGFVVPVAWRERASLVLLRMPGMWTMENR